MFGVAEITSSPLPVLTLNPPETSKPTMTIKLSPLPAVIVQLPMELLEPSLPYKV